MFRVAVLVANKSEEMEVIIPIDIWRRAGIIVNTISIEKNKNVVLNSGLKISCDSVLSAENLTKYHALYLPGGAGCDRFNEKLTPKLVAFYKKNVSKLDFTFMSACAATKCFYEWGLPADIKVTCYPGIQTGKFVSQYVNKTVSISKNFITTQGPGTIIEFSFEVVKKFVSPAIAKKVKTQMLIK